MWWKEVEQLTAAFILRSIRGSSWLFIKHFAFLHCRTSLKANRCMPNSSSYFVMHIMSWRNNFTPPNPHLQRKQLFFFKNWFFLSSFFASLPQIIQGTKSLTETFIFNHNVITFYGSITFNCFPYTPSNTRRISRRFFLIKFTLRLHQI